MKERYVVKHKEKDMFLTDEYYKPKNRYSLFLGNAHLFSAFELKLASKTVLINKKNYIVYRYKHLNDKEIILTVDKRNKKKER